MIAVDTNVLIYAHRLKTGCKFDTWMRHPVPGRKVKEQPYPRSHLVISLLDSSPSRMTGVPL